MDCQVRVLSVGQGKIQKQAKEKHKQAYLEGYTLQRHNETFQEVNVGQGMRSLVFMG